MHDVVQAAIHLHVDSVGHCAQGKLRTITTTQQLIAHGFKAVSDPPVAAHVYMVFYDLVVSSETCQSIEKINKGDLPNELCDDNGDRRRDLSRDFFRVHHTTEFKV